MDNRAPWAQKTIDLVPEHRRIVETMGVHLGIWGSALLAMAVFYCSSSAWPPSTVDWQFMGPLAAAGLLLVGWEIKRHRERTVLVRDNHSIEVYRKGRLDLIVEPEDIHLEKADIIIMVKIGVPLFIAFLIFTGVAVTVMFDKGGIDAESLIIVAAGLAPGGSLACAAWTRFRRRHLRVPVRGSRWMAEETVLVTPAQYDALFEEGDDPYPASQ